MTALKQLLLMDNECICPWWLAYTFDNRVRRIFHKPERIVASYLHEEMTALDIGCGMGFFSIGMAKIVGNTGSVIAVELQQNMLDILEKRAKQAGVSDRVFLYRCEPDNIGNHQNVDFALTFWMVHEVPNQEQFFKQIHTTLKSTGKLLLVEPKIHVSRSRYQDTVTYARQAGFIPVDTPSIRLSRATLFGKLQDEK
jgi:ubiquinone/menaquinone biosynthesis C-methylase UbiE